MIHKNHFYQQSKAKQVNIFLQFNFNGLNLQPQIQTIKSFFCSTKITKAFHFHPFPNLDIFSLFHTFGTIMNTICPHYPALDPKKKGK
jgi:hypothetical protein